MSDFDPYRDRKARDIRNRLSNAFVSAVEAGDFGRLESEVKRSCPAGIESVYQDFVQDRASRYRHAFDRIRCENIADPVRRAAVLWNMGLFFEVHEILETVWNGEQRWRKEALRGLIQAAGVYVHRERGAGTAAAKLAKRAAGHLKRHRADLAEIENVRELIGALGRPEAPAPNLRLAV